MKVVAVCWLVVASLIAGLVVIVAPWLPEIPEQEEPHGRDD
jgi:hypothetical protein